MHAEWRDACGMKERMRNGGIRAEWRNSAREIKAHGMKEASTTNRVWRYAEDKMTFRNEEIDGHKAIYIEGPFVYIDTSAASATHIPPLPPYALHSSRVAGRIDERGFLPTLIVTT